MMMTTENTVGVAKGQEPASPNWAKVHLIYFALAAFDLMAILAGLWLSDYTKSKFEQSIHSFQLSDLLRDNTSAVMSAAIDLSAPANSIFETGDVARERRNLAEASRVFDAAIVRDHFDPAVQVAMDAAVDAVGGSAAAHRRGGLAIWYPAIYAKFESVEGQIKKLKNLQVNETEATFESFSRGDRLQAAQHMDRSDEASRNILKKIRDLLELSAQVSDNTIAESKKSFDLGTMLQYLIGGGIMLMVLMVMTYAHFVGKLLRGKYNELEAAHAASTAFSAELRTVNDDVSKLNLDLAANMKKLTAAQDEIVREGKMAQLGQLTATVAHELRNPLGAVRTSTFLLERKTKGKELGIEPQIERINNGVVRCDNIITQLLDFARSSALTLKEAELDSWLTGLLEEEVHKLPAMVAIEFSPGTAGLTVAFDEGRLQRAVINLLSNASEAMVGKGDDPSKFATADPKITVTTAASPRGVEISVRDNGPGISAENMKKIMEPLFTTKNFGTGLGLPAIEKIMDLHGGGLEIASSPGEGACFTVWLPASQTRKDAA
jgi:signal transduction histidine kinase